jgi:hypothetical protein
MMASLIKLDSNLTKISKNKYLSFLPKKWLLIILKDVNLLHEFFISKIKFLTQNPKNEILLQKEKIFQVEMLSLKALIELKILLSK